MKFNQESPQRQPIFINQSNFSGLEADQKLDERRKALIPQIENLVSSEELFEGDGKSFGIIT